MLYTCFTQADGRPQHFNAAAEFTQRHIMKCCIHALHRQDGRPQHFNAAAEFTQRHIMKCCIHALHRQTAGHSTSTLPLSSHSSHPRDFRPVASQLFQTSVSIHFKWRLQVIYRYWIKQVSNGRVTPHNATHPQHGMFLSDPLTIMYASVFWRHSVSSAFPPIPCMHFVPPPTPQRATCRAHLIPLIWSPQFIFGERYKLWSPPCPVCRCHYKMART